jgi:hypothetical protein
MNNVQQAIRDAAEKGGYRYRWWKVSDLEHNEGYNALQLRALSEHFHDPDFWQALATARKWEDVNAWRFHWHRFVDHLADGKYPSVQDRGDDQLGQAARSTGMARRQFQGKSAAKSVIL